MAKKKQLPQPQAKIDLHDYSIEAAYGQVVSFLRRQQDRGLDIVEVVTGKSGMIRHEAPFWFETLGYKAQVAKHNGSFFVYL